MEKEMVFMFNCALMTLDSCTHTHTHTVLSLEDASGENII